MCKNTTAKTQDIHVQEDLFEQILNGFNSSSKKGKKNKGTTLSTVQKQRTPLVAQSLLKDKRTNYFTNVWVKQLNPISLKKIDDIIQNIKKLQEEEEEEEDNIEEDKDDEKKTFSILTAFKIYRYINTVSNLIITFNAIKRYNRERLAPLSQQLGRLHVNQDITKRAKKLLLMEQLRYFLLQLTQPLTTKLFNVIIKFYDGPKIAELFDKFEEWMAKEVGKEVAIQAAFWLAGKAVDVLTLGGSTAATTAASAAASAARWAAFANKVAKLANVAKSMKLVQRAKQARGATNMATGALDFLVFTNAEAEEFKADIIKIRDEEIAPFVDDMNDRLDQIERQVRNVETLILETVHEELDVLGKAEDIVGQARRDLEVMNRARAGVVQAARAREGEGVGLWSSGYTQVTRLEPNNSEQISIGMPESILFVRQSDNTFNEMLQRHSRMYNFKVTTQSLDRLMDQSTGLFFVRLINEAIDLVNNHFGKVYQAMDRYIQGIKENHLQVINDWKMKEEYKHFTDNLPTEIPDVIKYLAERVTIKKNRLGITSTPPPPPAPTTDEDEVYYKRVPWRLSNRTLQPLTPIILNGAMVGIDISMINFVDDEVLIEIDRFYGASNCTQLTGDIAKQILTQYNGESPKYDAEESYKTYIKIFDKMDQNKDILYDRELKVEKEIKQVVDELFEKITKEMAQ